MLDLLEDFQVNSGAFGGLLAFMKSVTIYSLGIWSVTWNSLLMWLLREQLLRSNGWIMSGSG